MLGSESGRRWREGAKNIPIIIVGGSLDDYTEGKMEGILLVQKNWHGAREFFELFFTKHPYYSQKLLLGVIGEFQGDVLAKTLEIYLCYNC